MFLKSVILRTTKYLKLHGAKATLNRVGRGCRNLLFYNRSIVYCRDLLQQDIEVQPMPEGCRVERFDKRSKVPDRLIERIAEFYSKEMLLDYINKRYRNGASLWCLRNDEEDFGYNWTLTGRAMTPYYFLPLMDRDIYLFDAFIFPSLRKHGLNSALLNYILKHYQSEGFHRAYLETNEWNTPVINLMAKNRFHRVGLAKMRSRGAKCKVTWWY